MDFGETVGYDDWSTPQRQQQPTTQRQQFSEQYRQPTEQHLQPPIVQPREPQNEWPPVQQPVMQQQSAQYQQSADPYNPPTAQHQQPSAAYFEEQEDEWAVPQRNQSTTQQYSMQHQRSTQHQMGYQNHNRRQKASPGRIVISVILFIIGAIMILIPLTDDALSTPEVAFYILFGGLSVLFALAILKVKLGAFGNHIESKNISLGRLVASYLIFTCALMLAFTVLIVAEAYQLVSQVQRLEREVMNMFGVGGATSTGNIMTVIVLMSISTFGIFASLGFVTLKVMPQITLPLAGVFAVLFGIAGFLDGEVGLAIFALIIAGIIFFLHHRKRSAASRRQQY